jgi:hypothetical protein
MVSGTETCFDARDTGVAIEKKAASNSVSETLILAGMLGHEKMGMTRKKAEIRVRTIKKPTSFSLTGGINQGPMFWIWPKISVVNRRTTSKVQPPVISMTTPTARSLGTMVRVMSRIDVTA